VSFIEKFGANLTKFTLGDCKDDISDPTLHAVATFCTDKLTEFDCAGNTSLTNEGVIAVLHACTCLTRLNVSSCVMLTEDVLFEISQGCDKIKHLNISHCTGIDKDSVIEFLMYKKLNELCYSDDINISDL
jgi:hypothetical protein